MIRAKAARIELNRGRRGVRNSKGKRFASVPTAAGVMARLACARVRAAGIEPEPLLRKAGLTGRQIESHRARLDAQAQITFLNLAADALQDDFLGFHLVQDFEPRELGLIHYVLASSDTLGNAFQRVERYCTLANEGVSLKWVAGKDVAIVFDYVGVARHSDRHQIEGWTAAIVRGCRNMTGLHLLPVRVTFTHRRVEDASELNTFLGCRVKFGTDRDELAFDKSAQDLPVVSADPYLNELLTAYCEEALARRRTGRGGLRADVENAIVPLLPHGEARAGQVARRLGMSQRTLARRLASEDLTFASVLDGLRLDLADRYLADADLSISEIAWLLGYREVSAFTHAFKRWTGKTPREVRTQGNFAGA
jgi:AraC-like DNA-binding protein